MAPVTNELHSSTPLPRIPIGISACLLGEPVRPDGSHARSAFCTEVLSQYFDLLPLCPEIAIGLGVPREPLQLVKSLSATQSPSVRVIIASNQHDVSEQLSAYGHEQASRHPELCGYIFMQQSPSCGVFQVPCIGANQEPLDGISGIYAAAFRQTNPLLPIEEAHRLNDITWREHFIMRVLAYYDFQQICPRTVTAKELIDFHSRYKYLVMAHSLKHYKSMGRLLGNLRNQDLANIASEYFQQLMTALATPATRKTHSNTLMHLQGYLKTVLSAPEKAELTDLIHQYRTGKVPLITPLLLLKQHLSCHPDFLHYALDQVYMNPHELSLRH